MQRQALGAAIGKEAPPIVHEVLRSPGQPLDSGVRGLMEPRFGHDFSRVRIHSGPTAEQSARDLNANAYTVGHDIVFGAGRFIPGTHEGQRLIAHELTHVVQQSGSTSTAVQRQSDPKPTETTDDQQPSLFTVIIADPRKRSDKRFARKHGQADATRIQESGTLSLEDRQLVNAKLRFFEGDAKDAYARQVKPALVLATQPVINMKPVYVGKLPDGEPAEQARIRRRRERTLQFFAKVKDHNLEEAYINRLQRYLDEGMEANSYWDVEMIEQIIYERAPNAPWHEAARQDFLVKRVLKLRTQEREKRLTTLSPYWQNQFGALAERTQGWPEEVRVYARDLLWKWNEHIAKYDNVPYLRDVVQPVVAEEMIFKEIVGQYEIKLRERDRAIQEECRLHPPGRLMKVWGDPCKPWFSDSGGRGEHELWNIRMRMRIFSDKDRVPYLDIFYWLQEYMKQVRALPTHMAGVHLQILQSWSMVQGGFMMANKPMKNLPTPGAGAVRGVNVGDIGWGTFIKPLAWIARPLVRVTARSGRALVIGVILGLREADPTAFAGIASRTSTVLVNVEQRTVSGIASQAVIEFSERSLAQAATSRAGEVVGSISSSAGTEARAHTVKVTVIDATGHQVVEALTTPTGDAAVDRAINEAFAATFDQTLDTSVSLAPGQGVVPVAPEVAAGFTLAQVSAFRQLLGRAFDSAGISILGELWNATARPGDAAILTEANSRYLFGLHRNRFWSAVRADPQARALFEAAGCQFSGGAPYYMLNGRRITITIDHIIERQLDYSLALTAANLQLSFSRENSVVLRLLNFFLPN
ncbi:MAG TPA: DUF4157 domain-containing protein [Chloroflexia bacterium]|nr:DUF4157 domain-containing protein [Chloroflexia bacterium]